MSRLLTLLLLYQNGYSVGKYISIEKEIEKTKDRYYDVLERAGQGWHEEKNDPTPFIRYMLTALLSCYTEFEDRVGIMDEVGAKSSAYEIVKRYVDRSVGKIKSSDVIANCPSIGRTAALDSVKRLVEEGLLVKHGSGKATFYTKKEVDEWFTSK